MLFESGQVGCPRSSDGKENHPQRTRMNTEATTEHSRHLFGGLKVDQGA